MVKFMHQACEHMSSEMAHLGLRFTHTVDYETLHFRGCDGQTGPSPLPHIRLSLSIGVCIVLVKHAVKIFHH